MYQEIFRRKSFHKFKNTVPLTIEELNELKEYISKEIVPLNAKIRTHIQIVKASETSSSVNAEYCILFYSEKKENYLENIGYLGEQIDLFCVSKNIGTLWYGFGKTNEKQFNHLDFVIMIAISKVEENSFRNSSDKINRKSLEKIWVGDELNIAEVVRLSPSAINSQPWFVEVKDGVLSVFRTKAKLGIVPLPMLGDYNRIDIGIFLYILELCLFHEKRFFERKYFLSEEKKKSLSKIAEYHLK